MMLELTDINAGYGDLQVLYDVSLEVNEGECVALVGSNGAGKTTLLWIISGLLPVKSGQVKWFGEDMIKMPAHRRAELGIAHIPQGRGILGTLSVKDNLILGGFNKRVKTDRDKGIEETLEMFPRLKGRLNQVAGSLSGGEQQMLAIARALVMKPKLLMLDEPSLGLAPIVVEEVFETISRVRDEGMSILIIEQNLAAAMAIAQRGYVLENGRVSLSGTSEALLYNEDVKRAYLGI